MNKNNRAWCRKYKMNAREYRQLRHIGEMYCKELKKSIDVDKSKHTLFYTPAAEKTRKKHPSWYINGKTV